MADYRMVCPWDNIDPKAYMQCPYDKTHMVMAVRFTRHLKKCIKSHRGRDFVTCPFRSWYVMKKPMLQNHTSVCPYGKFQELDVTRGNENNEEAKGKPGAFKQDGTDIYTEIRIPQTE